jgi:hypothetical protein
MSKIEKYVSTSLNEDNENLEQEKTTIPTLEDLKNIEITLQTIEKFKHTPIDINLSNWEDNS